MTRKFFTSRFFIFFLLLCALGYYCYDRYQISQKKDLPPTPVVTAVDDTSVSTITSPTHPEKPEVKMQKEIKIDDAIAPTDKTERAKILAKKAEFLGTNNEFNEAMELYERSLRLMPSVDVERKLAHMAFKAKKYQRSADLYKKNIEALSLPENQEYLNALRYTGDGDFSSTLANLDLPDDTREAFQVSWTCEHEFISCENAIKTARTKSKIIQELQAALKNYETIGTKDTSYKEALLIGTWYKYGDYTTAIRIGENLLRRKPDYRPILKIVGFSSYMIGQYDRAQAALSKFKKLEPKDPEVDFVLGLIQFEKGDYETSNIYFNNAVLGGYKPKTVVERKLAYNYYILGLAKNMFQVLGYLVLEPDITESDMSNAIYLALANNETRNAGEWIKQGTQKFPQSNDIRGLRAWYLLQTEDTAGAQTIVTNLLEKNPNHLISLVLQGMISYNANEKLKAKTYFKKAQVIDAGGTWSELIESYLGKLAS